VAVKEDTPQEAKKIKRWKHIASTALKKVRDH
jgi:hypothetical protein